MAVKIALDSFVAVLKRSNLVAGDQLQALIDEFQRNPGRSNDARQFADALVKQKILTPWQADKLLQGKHKGFFLGKYRLLSLVGKGGMSTVYLAEHLLMRRLCAIKVLPTRRLQNASYLARFHREAQAVASLDHRNIVRAYDVDQATDGETEIHFLVMEYVEGKGLLDLVLGCPNSRLPPVVAAEYIRQAALGLQHAHSAGLVHRDVKPGNLLIDMQGTVKVLDLGLARFFDSGDENSLTVQHDERVLGTADYLAPEQAVDSHRVDSRADIYSLGCTLYLCLAGQPPFTQGSLAQRLLAHQTREPPLVESIEPLVPQPLGDIVRKMMAKDPANRYQTAADVAVALEDWLKTTPKSDFDRTFAGLDRPTPYPPSRQPESSRADTVRRGSRADTSSTPQVERRPRDSTSPTRPKANPANSPQTGAHSQPASTRARPTGEPPNTRREDQETAIGAPPVPPTKPAAALLPDVATGSLFFETDESTATLESDSVDFTSDRFAADGPVPFELAGGDDDAPVQRRSARKRASHLQDGLVKLRGWQSAIQDRLQRQFPQRRQRAQVFWGAVGAGTIIVAGLLIWALQRPVAPTVARPIATPKSPDPPPVTQRNLGPELKVGGDQSDFPTISEAIDYIHENRQKFSGKSTWTINVAGGNEYQESIRIFNSGADPFP
ncbi:MAG: protein kinase, partial [Planctomycetaceae bacterium]|nr:protein kinase [Planctomycetaceae bacterium]